MSYKMAAFTENYFRFVLFSILLLFQVIAARKHHLRLDRDRRPVITLSSFGFLKKGILFVNVTDLSFPESSNMKNVSLGFTLGVSKSTGAEGYMEEYPGKCVLKAERDQGKTDEDVKEHDYSIVFFRLNFKSRKIEIERKGKAVQNLIIATNKTVDQFRLTDNAIQSRRRRAIPEPPPKKDSLDVTEEPNKKITPKPDSDSKGEPEPATNSLEEITESPVLSEPVGGAKAEPAPKVNSLDEKQKSSETKEDKSKDQPTAETALLKEIPIFKKDRTDTYNFNFLVAVTRTEEEGMYNLNFHNCLKAILDSDEEVSFTVDLTEINDENYLSAGAMVLPTLYFLLSLTYIVVAIIWNTVLCKSDESVYKMHYLMLVVVFVKSLSCLFHAVNYHFISKEGIQEEAWAVLFYIAYLTRGALLFVTIILIGSGWAFIKHVLSDREKKLFLIFIPLQILDNIAYIIVEESEEGQSQYTVWKEIFILIDLLCCGAILFPVVWSIKHLQDASRANGKEIFSLTKLKLFRQFYIMVVCYIYFTRIIVYLLKLTVPFKYEWMDELFKELATLTFFVITGYKFKPASDNPYLQVPTDEDEEEMEMDEVIVGQSANIDTVKKVNQGQKDEQTGVKLRESSHEYD